jgi:hypothetical protein
MIVRSYQTKEIVMRTGNSTIIAVGIAALITNGAALAAPEAYGPESKADNEGGRRGEAAAERSEHREAGKSHPCWFAPGQPIRAAGNDCQILNAEDLELNAVLSVPISIRPTVQKTSLSKKLSDGGFNLARGAVSSVIP